MGRVLAIDYGEKRCGLAMSDALAMIASPLDTVPTADIWNYLDKLIPQQKVTTVVVGEARYLNGEESETTKKQALFVKQLQAKFPHLSLARVDEMYTSKLAQDAILQAGVSKKKRQDKGLVDAIAATLILQHYLG
jgi:putative Holliday junction resolvase